MASALELLKSFVQKKNPSVDAFVADAEKIKTAIQKDRVSGRSPVRLNGTIYMFDLLGETLGIDGRERALDVLTKLQSSAHDEDDTEFRGVIENTYGGTSVAEGQPKRRGRKPKDQVQSRKSVDL
ncbi:hypothetical protein CN184_28225 [Sinorhizobium medicae]|uniref:hypothetical protein n=1 Tax=Sinorhizobium medicae TaxID=110321 RepID=UPI000FD38E6A|nr:hypothetical protein [Sinorhizobium medicae]RVJ16632.1 hypothetical protein CN184_28225 [Sinorhizobium medicae]